MKEGYLSLPNNTGKFLKTLENIEVCYIDNYSSSRLYSKKKLAEMIKFSVDIAVKLSLNERCYNPSNISAIELARLIDLLKDILVDMTIHDIDTIKLFVYNKRV